MPKKGRSFLSVRVCRLIESEERSGDIAHQLLLEKVLKIDVLKAGQTEK